jgi:hypothetical protein
MNLGVELFGQRAWETCYRYKNWCKAAEGWTEYNAGTWVLSGDDVSLTSAGYPSNIPINTVHRSTIQAVWTSYAGNGGRNSGVFPSGNYVFTYSGSVENIDILGNGLSNVSKSSGRITFTSDGTETMYIELSGTISDALSDFVLCESKYEGDWESGDYWYPQVLNELAGFACLEFEAWDLCAAWTTTSTPYPTWQQIRDKDYYCYHRQPIHTSADRYKAGTDFRHVPYELQADLVNQTESNIWITIPYWASDAFVTSLATYMSDTLHSSATIYIEYAVEPFFNGSSESPFTQGAKYCYDQGVLAEHSNPQVDYYATRANEIFGLFVDNSTHTVRPCVTSATNDTWSGYCFDWISNLVAHIVADDIEDVEEWSSSIYPGDVIDPDDGGMGETWANWVSSGTAEDVNTYLNSAVITYIGYLEDLKDDISSTNLPLGLYEFGESPVISGFSGEDPPIPAQADTIGDLVREALNSEDEHWRTTYLLNAVDSICSGTVIYYRGASVQDNESPWGISDTNLDLLPWIGNSENLPDATHPRYYAMKEFVRIHFLTGEDMTSGTPILDAPLLGQVHAFSASGLTSGLPTLGRPGVSTMTYYNDSPAPGVLRCPGRLIVTPTDLSGSYPYGGTFVGKARLVTLLPMGVGVRVPSEGLGDAGDILEADHRYVFSCFLRGWSDPALELLFGDNYSAGDTTGHAVFSSPGTAVTGTSALARAKKIIFVPDDTIHAPAILIYSGVADWAEGSELAWQRAEELGLPIIIECMVDSSGNVLEIGRLEDLTL